MSEEIGKRLRYDAIQETAEAIEKCYEKGGNVYIMGNGGSAAAADHFACDLIKRGLPAYSLNANAAVISMIANDYGYEYIFQKQLEAYLHKNDLVLVISASGNSPNILRAVEWALECDRDARVIALAGRTGGQVSRLVPDTFCAYSEDPAKIENVHLQWLHEIARLVFG